MNVAAVGITVITLTATQRIITHAGIWIVVSVVAAAAIVVSSERDCIANPLGSIRGVLDIII